MFKAIVFLGLVVIAGAFDYKSLPGLNYEKWWGDGEEIEDTRILRYNVEFPEKAVKDLVYRLNHRRQFLPSMDDAAYNYGVNTKTIGYWLDYWANDYNFTEREAYMNQYPQYITDILGLKIHFIWIVPEVPEGKTKIPVLMMHGYPGSVREFYEVIPKLAADCADTDIVLELVIPSLPGFGFSDYTNKTGLGFAEMSVMMKLLMNRLGHEKFIADGGDWGAHIGFVMATFFPETLIGYHSNLGSALTNKAFSMLSIGSVNPGSIMPQSFISRLYPLKDTFKYLAQESGYFHMQASKPDTIGVSVTDSPSAMLAWIFQFISISSRRANINDTRGGLDLYTADQLLDNAMTYWIPNKTPTAFRIYAESFNLRNYRMGYINVPTPVPTVIVQASDEILYMPPDMLRTKYSNLVSVVPLDDYGHFLALEAPDLYSKLLLSGITKILKYRRDNNMDVQKEKGRSSSCSLHTRHANTNNPFMY